MFDDTRKFASILLLCIAAFSSILGADAAATTPMTAPDKDQRTLQEKLQEAENNYRSGKVDIAITQATGLIGNRENSALESDQVERDTKADLALFQLKAGHPDESARLIRELLLSLQLEMPMDTGYSANPAETYVQTPNMLKDYFGKIVERLHESADTKLIIDALINNTVPKDYSAQLKPYCKRMQVALESIKALQSIADAEELRYGDPLTSLAEDDTTNKSDPQLATTKLEQLAATIEALATQAQQMPVGDARAALGLYTLALIANSAQHYAQAESFAQSSLAHVRALTDNISGLPDIQIALAYALLKQDKVAELKALKTEILKNAKEKERVLVTMARFTEATHDDAEALNLYQKALDNRAKRGNKQPPEWVENYNQLLKKTSNNSL